MGYFIPDPGTLGRSCFIARVGLLCFAMLAFSFILLRNDYKGVPTRIGAQNWTLILLGCLVIVIAWMWDYVKYSGRISDAPDKAMEVLATYVPQQFNWWLFGVGEMLILIGLFLYYRRSRRETEI